MKKLQDEIGTWGANTFPRYDKDAALVGLAHHLKDEAEEVFNDTMDMYEGQDKSEEFAMELADVGILLFQLAHESDVDLEKAIREKMEINYKRKWQKPDERGVFKHAE